MRLNPIVLLEEAMEIEGKVALVSGGGSGISRATVLALIERGAKVVVADSMRSLDARR